MEDAGCSAPVSIICTEQLASFMFSIFCADEWAWLRAGFAWRR